MTSRRQVLFSGFAAALTGGRALAYGQGGGTLIAGLDPEPLALASAGSIDAGASRVSVAIFDRLFNYDLHGRLMPQLAADAQLAKDGLSVTVRLRPNLRWHDGKALTSRDVAFSITEVWRKYHARSQMALANLVGAKTPDALTTVLHFSKPAPYIFATFADGSSQVVPAHIYAGGDILTNPNNLAPIGSGPFQFVRWDRGSHVVLKRNPDYWDAGKPWLDQLIFRVLPNGAATAAALETGTVQYATDVALSDVARLADHPAIAVQRLGANYSANFQGFGFNLDRPLLRDVRVRQAFAHAIDRDFLVKNIWRGFGVVADSPIPPGTSFHAPGLPRYGFDPRKAEALLDAAGHHRGPDGIRFTIRNEVMPPYANVTAAAQYIRASLARIGVRLELRNESLGAYLKRIFTNRDFDTNTYGTGSDFDPALGIQRFYWSKAFQPGTPWTNPTHYNSPEADRLLLAAQGELDPERRRALYFQVQQVVQRDLPLIPLLFPTAVVLTSRRLRGVVSTRYENFASARFA